MAEDNELEKRAIEELLRETDRARVRAETMGPAGWLKCPLRSTNKRFLLNTLRSTGLQRRTGEPGEGHPAARGRLGSQTPDGSRDRSGSPPRDRRSNGGRADHNNHHREVRSYDKNEDGDKERSYRHRGRRPGDDGQSRNRAHK